ncbi:FeoB-associated Cys-rich membrane protein [Sunxiuqinia elliptica]
MELNLQDILAYLAVITAVIFLIRKFFFNKKKSDSGCGGTDCGCH